jgi:hypothetical protein
MQPQATAAAGSAPGTIAPPPAVATEAAPQPPSPADLGPADFAWGSPAGSRRMPGPLAPAASSNLLPSPLTVALAAVALAVVVFGLWWLFGRGDSPSVQLSLVVPREGAMLYRVQNTAGADAELVGKFEFDSEFEGILTLRTRSVEGDLARITGLLDISRLIWNGRPETGRPTLRSRISLRADGNIVRGQSFDAKVPAGTYDPVIVGLSPDLPQNAVRLGDSWSDQYQVRGKDVLIDVTTSTRFVRVEDLGGVPVAVVQGTRTLDLTPREKRHKNFKGSITVNQTAWIDPAMGKVLRMSATIKGSLDDTARGWTFSSDSIEQLNLTAI